MTTGDAERAAPAATIPDYRRLMSEGRKAEARALMDRFVEAVLADSDGGLVAPAVAGGEGHPVELHDFGCAFAEKGADDAAEPFLRAAWQALPGQPQVMRNLAQVLMRRGDVEGAREAALDQLARRPGDTFALALAAITAAELGDAAEAARLLDFDRLVRPIRLDPPQGYASIAAFNEALCETVLARPDLRLNPADRTTRGGRQSGALFPARGGPLVALQALIIGAVQQYAEALPRDPGHPFLAQRPANLGLHGWATVLDFGGFQEPHIHPSGWLSGVYYPRLPGLAQNKPGNKAGWLAFGRPSSGFHPKADYPAHHVEPQEGLVVLFPSYFHHNTEPFAGLSARISLAFDLIPRR